ncbi:LAME_0F18822g1_1 [Lachancea meyersii CBS 8951]|uniref:LAME_0F18822g1_1 n=1 Tax=Lachancea meyersii CBS 8951 TaxID=1266667 RepID=A0A1G4K101_9SACH|nr:LAME_0F18822g1_1 [Lachancea meyersii CBS 8951]
MLPAIHKWNHPFAILSTVAFPHKKILFAGTHDSKILCFDLTTYNLVKTIHLGDKDETHTRSSVLCMTKSQDEQFLFSAGADSLIRIWSIGRLTSNGDLPIREAATLYSLLDIGDIFSLKYLDAHQTIVFGCQNANMLYMTGVIDRMSGKSECNDMNRLPHRRYDKFFDSTGPGSISRVPFPSPASPTRPNHTIMEIPLSNSISYAHNSFIYSIQPLSVTSAHLPDALYVGGLKKEDTDFIVSGGGDGLSKVWAFSRGEKCSVNVQLVAEMDNDESVLCQVVKFPFLYCGLNGGYIKIWDLNLNELVSTLRSPSRCDIVSVSVHDDHIFAAHEKGITKFHKDEIYERNVEDSLVLSTEILKKKCTGCCHLRLATGAKSGSLTLWNISGLVGEHADHGMSVNLIPNSYRDGTQWSKCQSILDNDSMLETLRDLVSFQTVSASNESQHAIDSRRCASYLQQVFTKLGATCELLPIGSNDNPLVHATFKGKSSSKSKIVWYGHYDIISPGDPGKWDSDPYVLTCENGYLKGRGVTDNKGPLAAAIYSAGSCFSKGTLEKDIVFLVEGQEESNSQGFAEAIKKHRNLLGNDVDWVLFSNSYWIDEKTPCLNYGLRGVINVQLRVWSGAPDRHSGLDGGVHREPTTDLSRLLSKLQDDDGRVLIPGFYTSLADLNDEDKLRFEQIFKRADLDKSVSVENLMAKWTQPSLSITNMRVSGPGNATVIPHSAYATLSIRIVPGQDVHVMKLSLEQYIAQCFQKFHTSNQLEFKLLNEAEPWLGEPNNAAYQVLKQEILEAWGIDPLFVREGGSIPQVRFLERALGSSAIQIPCGQSTDNAHLNNERLRIENWYKIRQILQRAFTRL